MAGKAFSSKYFCERAGSGGAADPAEPWDKEHFPHLLHLQLGWRLGNAIANHFSLSEGLSYEVRLSFSDPLCFDSLLPPLDVYICK